MSPFIVAIWIFVGVWIFKKSMRSAKPQTGTDQSPKGRDDPPRASALGSLSALFTRAGAAGSGQTKTLHASPSDDLKGLK